MLEARVKSTGINQIGEAELFNVPEPLKKRVLDQSEISALLREMNPYNGH